jgi:hypothetical protein
VNRPVFLLEDLDPERPAVLPGFFDHLLRNEVMMDVDRASAHNPIL